MFSAQDECIRLKNALVNLGNSKDWDSLVKRAEAGELDGVNVLLRPVSAESLDNLVATSTSPFMMRETTRAAQALNSPAPGGFVIVSDEGSDLVDQPYPQVALYDYPAQEQWSQFQRLAQMLMQTPFSAEGIVTSLYTDANGTRHIGLHRMPDSAGLVALHRHLSADDRNADRHFLERFYGPAPLPALAHPACRDPAVLRKLPQS